MNYFLHGAQIQKGFIARFILFFVSKLKEVSKVWGKVFGNWKYLILGIFAIVFFYLFNVIIGNLTNIKSFYSLLGFVGILKYMGNFAIGFKDTVTPFSFYTLAIISLLFGIFLSLLVFKINSKIKNNSGTVGIVGAFLGIFAPGCAACGIGLVSTLGLSASFLAIFPYKGLELSIISIMILSFTIFKISKDLTMGDVCKIDLTKMKGGKYNGRKK